MTKDEAISILRNTAWLGTEDKVTEAIDTLDRPGKWVLKDTGYFCSECHVPTLYRGRYCMNCGARMIGGDANDA